MPTFAYEGRTADGQTKKGKIDAVDANAARNQLKRQNINPTSVSEAEGHDARFGYLHPSVCDHD